MTARPERSARALLRAYLIGLPPESAGRGVTGDRDQLRAMLDRWTEDVRARAIGLHLPGLLVHHLAGQGTAHQAVAATAWLETALEHVRPRP